MSHSMMTRSRKRREAMAWPSLPTEMRLLILETIAHQKNPGWASLASVCREWQHVLEKRNFHKLKLHVPCLDDFERVVSPQKRELIHHLYFDIELPQYKSRCCSRRRTAPGKISSIVKNGLRKLHLLLGTWGPARNLALEINVYSPSDCEHWFKNIYLSSDDSEQHHGDYDTPDPPSFTSTSTSTSTHHYHDPQHGWVHGQRVRDPPVSSITRLFRPIDLVFNPSLPRVEAVTCLIIRRQLRRSITPWGLGELLGAFPRLERVCYEPWAPSCHPYREFHDRAISIALRKFLPDTVNSLVIFEDAHAFYDWFPKRSPTQTQTQTPPVLHLLSPTHGLAVVFAVRSLALQHLAISFMINAEDIFRACELTWRWSHLQSLALTSQLLLEDNWEERRQLVNLLCRASAFVQRMPKLLTFVLWNGGRGHACAFIYRIDRGTASITWRGTWNLELSPVVVERWRRTAVLKLPRSELEVKQERVEEVIDSHGDAVHHLRLPCQVVDPASVWQIRREGRS